MNSMRLESRPLASSGLALLSFAGWVFLAWLSHHPPALVTPWLQSVLALQWVLTAFALRPAAVSSPVQSVLWGVAFRLAGLVALPILEDDYFRFLWDGRMFALTGNPYASTPSDHFANPTVPDAFGDILDRINYPEVPTLYGPVCQVAFLIAYWAAPGSLLSWKALLVGADLLFLIALYFLARRERGLLAAQVVMFAAWCPLSVFETAFNAHPDALGILLVTAAALAWHTSRPGVVGLACGAAVAAKVFALLLVPFFLWRKPRAAWLACGLTIVACYAPFWIQGSAADLEGLRILSTEWEFNSSLYALLALMLEPSLARVTAAVLFLAVWGLALYAHHISGRKSGVRAPHRNDSPTTHIPNPGFPTVHFPVLLIPFFLLSPTFNPWYALWLLPFVALRPSRTGLACMAAVSLSYLTNQNMGLANPDGFGHPLWVRPLEFGLITLAALSDFCSNRRPLAARVGTIRT